MAFLLNRTITRRGGEQTVTQEVAGDLLRIGRGPGNDLHLDDFAVSYAHATITVSDGRYFLRDLTGAGLTLLNQQPVQDAEVRTGDRIRIGPYLLHLTSGDVLTIQVEEIRERGVEEPVALLPSYTLSTTRWNTRTLAVLVSLLVLGGTAMAFGLGMHKVFMPGNVSLKHSLFANDCLKCHSGWKVVWEPIADKTCLSCHSGPPHFRDRSVKGTPQCATCHVEHKGKSVLASVPDMSCAACHGDLKVKDGLPRVAPSVHNFTNDHPEFAVSIPAGNDGLPRRVRLDDKSELKDYSELKLNHKLHLAADLSGPNGPEQLTCASCHIPDARGAYMQPITYQRDCMRCHLLDFDDRLGLKTVPHPQKPDEVRHFLQSVYAEYYLLTHEAEFKGRPMAKRLPGAPPTVEEVWVGNLTVRAEQYLYSKKTKKCVLCHRIEFPGGPLNTASPAGMSFSQARPMPAIAKTAVPPRWLANSIFNHAPHNDLIKQKGCVACHGGAEASEMTSDVLLPSIKSCRECHFDPGGARAECTECHVYHDKTKQRESQHPYELDAIRQRAGGG